MVPTSLKENAHKNREKKPLYFATGIVNQSDVSPSPLTIGIPRPVQTRLDLKVRIQY